MKKLLLSLLIFPFLAISSENNNDDFPLIMFKQGVMSAQICHVKYQISEIVFNLKENGKAVSNVLKPARDNLGNQAVDEILNFHGDKSDYLNNIYKKCVEDAISRNESEYN